MLLSPALREKVQWRRLMAIHEAGHVLVARHLGIDAYGFVWHNEKSWSGCAPCPGAERLSREEQWMISLAGGAAIMKMQGLPAKDFFQWKPYLCMDGDWTLMKYEPTRENARWVVSAIEVLIKFFTRGELMRVSTAIIRMSRDEQNADKLKTWRDYCYEQKYPVASPANAEPGGSHRGNPSRNRRLYR